MAGTTAWSYAAELAGRVSEDKEVAKMKRKTIEKGAANVSDM